MTSPFLTVKEVSTLLRVSEKTIYRHIREIPGGMKLFNGTWLFDRETLLTELKQKSAKPREESRSADRHKLL